MAPTSRMTAASFGEMPTTSVRPFISPSTRSTGLVECNFGLGLRGDDRQAQHLAPAGAVDADCDDHRDRDDVAVAARLHIGRIQPDIGPFTLQGPIEEGCDLAVDLAAQP